uniref:Putative structural protein n=1 Tax=viral metagenome TaxID=1070528 RepID=A0A6M3L5N1_9ZZZZ
MTTYIDGMRSLEVYGGGNILAGRRVRDVAEEISLLDANQTALLTLIRQLRRKKTNDVKFEWQEDVFPARSATINEATVSSAETDFTVSDGTLFRAGDLWILGNTGELVYVTNVASNVVTVTRRVGGTTGTVVTNGDDIHYVGTGHPTGMTARAKLTTQITQPYNYCQIFKEAFEVDNTLAATKLYGGTDRSYLRYKHAQIHNRDIERAFWFGGRDDLTSADDNYATAWINTTAFLTKGLVGPDGAHGFITTNALGNDSSAYTEDDFDEDLRAIFRYGSGVKFLFGAPIVMSVISSWGRDALQTVPRDTTYGINIMRYVSPHGELNLINNKLFYDMADASAGTNNIDFTKLAVILDLENIWYRYLRDTMLEMGIQENDKDAVEDQYLTECGIMCKQEKTHGYLTDFDLS